MRNSRPSSCHSNCTSISNRRIYKANGYSCRIRSLWCKTRWRIKKKVFGINNHRLLCRSRTLTPESFKCRCTNSNFNISNWWLKSRPCFNNDSNSYPTCMTHLIDKVVLESIKVWHIQSPRPWLRMLRTIPIPCLTLRQTRSHFQIQKPSTTQPSSSRNRISICKASCALSRILGAISTVTVSLKQMQL